MRSYIFVIAISIIGSMFVSTQAFADEIAWDKIIGAKINKLNAAQKKIVARNLNNIKNTRGCTGTLAKCLASGDRSAARHAGFVVRMVYKSKTDEFIKNGVKKRYESAFSDEKININLSGHPGTGSKSTKVVIVEYACFQCPFCAHLAPKLKTIKKKFGNKVAHFYKFFPVRSHKHGVSSAIAGLAAHRQGKFWKMYDLMYANRTDLTDQDLKKYAAQAGLDMVKFNADIKDKSLMKIIEKDKLEGMRFGVEGTPTFFVNGKLYQGAGDFVEIMDRISEEIDIVEGKVK